MSTFSVCPKPSRIVMPQAPRTFSMTSGLSGSPALTSSRSFTLYAPRSSSKSIRQTVGGAQKRHYAARSVEQSGDLASKRA